jgi:hypothetical protein
LIGKRHSAGYLQPTTHIAKPHQRILFFDLNALPYEWESKEQQNHDDA